MDTATLSAVVALVIGGIGLLACWAAMARVLPDHHRRWWRRVREHWHGRHEQQPPSHERGPSGRRVVTGASAADRLTPGARPGGHPAMRPDVLRRERERLSAEQARRIVEEIAADEPERLAGVVDQWLAEDRRRALHREGRR